ncbi:MAG TPA: GH25 family lysozyme [Flavobacterium sp.]|nr:GH25 family lysozyme [Flavobacterium sp.]
MAKVSANKSPVKSRGRRKSSFLSGKISPSLIVVFLIFVVFGTGYYYREALAYYFSFKSDKIAEAEAVRNSRILDAHKDNVIGFDVSEYQGKINWEQTDSIEGLYPLEFVFIRATYGKDCKDLEFAKNWQSAGKQKLIRGAYHYYRPDENSLEQAQNFINNVTLRKGDFPPVLDIERIPEGQSVDSLKLGLKRWLKKVENHYKVKPIIYCGENYYYDFLASAFKDYTVWIANYNFLVEEIEPGWQFWQFTQSASVPGILGDVDVDIFNGKREDLQRVTIK